MEIYVNKGEKLRVVAFFRDSSPLPKKWLYVDNLEKFQNFLNVHFNRWVYVNIYRQNGIYAGRIYNRKNPLK